MAYSDEEIETAPDVDQPEQAPAADPGKDYISKVHATLKDNIAGFDKSEDEFRKLITTDADYRKKVHATLTDNIDGFNKTAEVFDDSIGVKKKDSGLSAISNTKVVPGQVLPASGSSAGKKTSADDFLKSIAPKSPEVQHAAAVQSAINNINGIDLTKTKEELVKSRIRDAQMGKMQSLIQQNPIDNTATTGFNQRIQKYLPKDMPVSLDDHEINNIKQYVDNDQRLALKVFADKHPEKAAQIKKDQYLIDSQQTSNNREKQLANADKIATGDYDYSIWHGGPVQKKMGVVDSFLNGWHERTKELDDFEDFAKLDDAGSVKKLEEERNNHDPDEPVPTPSHIGADFAGMLGSNGIPMAKAGAVSALSTFAASPEAAPWLAAALTTPEYTSRAMVGSLKSTYNQLRNEGMGQEEAWKKAKTQAAIDGAAAAAQGAIQTFSGVKAGNGFSFQPAVKSIVGEALKTTKEFALHSLPNAAAVGGLELAKNTAANVNGVKRGYMDNVLESAGGQLMFEGGMAIIAKAGKFGGQALGKGKQLLMKQNLAEAPQENIDAALANQVADGNITPEEANNTREELKQQANMNALIPESVKNPETRLQIQKLIERKQAHEESMKTVDKSFHAGIKEKILGIDEKIADLAASPEAKQEPVEEKADTPATGNLKTAGDATEPPAPASVQQNETFTDSEQPKKVNTDVSDTHVGDIPEKPVQREQPLETNNHKVVYEDGKRVAYDKAGEKVPQFVKNKSGKTVLNKKYSNILQKHAESYNYNFGEKAPEINIETANHVESARHFIDASNNPAEIAEVFVSTPKEDRISNAKEEAIANYGLGKIKAEGFYRFDDRNNSNNNLGRTYLVGKNNPEGMGIDQIAQAIADHSGLKIEPQDIADYMKKFPSGGDPTKLNYTEIHEHAAERFEKLTGIPLNDKTAALAVEQLHADKIPEAINHVDRTTETLGDDELLKVAEESKKVHNFNTDGTNTNDTEIPGSSDGEAENGSVRKQPSTTSTGGNTTADVHNDAESKPGESVKSTEKTDQESSHKSLNDDFDKHVWRPFTEDPFPKHGSQSTSTEKTTVPKTFKEALSTAKETFKDDPIAQRAIVLIDAINDKSKLVNIDFSAGEHEGHKISENALGYSFPDKSIGINWGAHASEADALRTFLHEGLHNATRDAINNDLAFRGELDGLLDNIRDAMDLPKGSMGDVLIPALVEKGVIPADKYGASNAHELIAEVFTNPKFAETLKELEYKGDNMLKRVYDAIVKYFSEKYKGFIEAKSGVSADNIADYLMGLTENVLKKSKSNGESGGALASLKGVEKEKIIKEGGNLLHTLLRLKKTFPSYAQIVDELIHNTDKKSLSVETRLVNENKEATRAFYHSSIDKLYFDGNFEGKPQTIIHEAIHALTALKLPERKPDIYNGESYLDTLKKQSVISQDTAQAKMIDLYIDAVAASGLTEDFFGKDGLANNEKTFHRFSYSDYLFDKYGFYNLHEFIAEAFSNKKFQDHLKSIQIRGTTVWDKFIKFVGNALGIKQNNMLDEVIQAGKQIIASGRPTKSDEFGSYYTTLYNSKPTKIQDWVNKHLAGGKSKEEITAVLKEKLGVNDKQAEIFFQQAPEEMAKKEKHYEEIIGAKPFKGSGRIAVEPIIGGEPKNITQISADLAKNTESKIFNMKPGRRGSLGTYNTGNTGIKIRYAGDMDVTAHEMGHKLDDEFKILTNLSPQAKFELAPFMQFGSKPPKGHSNPAAYKLNEGFAEWLRAYVVNPAKAIAAAPETFKAYNTLVSENYRNGIQTFSDDVRTFAGASGRDQTLANVQWKPDEKKTLLQEIFDRSKPKNMFQINWTDKVAANYVNPMRVVEKGFEYAKGIKGIDAVLPADDPIIGARLLLSNDRKFGEFMENGFHDANDKPILDADGNPQNFKWLLEPLDNTDEASLTRESKTTAAYMLAERTVELESKFGRDNVLSGIGGGVFKDIDVAKKTLDEIKNGDPELYKRVQQAADRYRSMSDNMLQYMVDKGRLSPEQYKLIKDNNLFYVAMNRIIETEPGQEIQVVGKSSGALGSKAEIIKSIKGSSREIQNPYVSLLDNVHRGIKEADRNSVMQAYTEMVEGRRSMHQGDVEKLAEIGVKGMQGDKETIPVFKNGKVEHWKFQPDIYAALKGLDSDAKSLPGYLTLHARVLRSMTTKFPTFAARNWVRDIQDRLIKSNDRSGFRDLFGDKKHWEDVARNGGLNSGYYMKSATHYYGLMEEAMKGLSKEKKSMFADPTQLKKLWRGYENILEKGETSNRVAEYRAAMREAKSKGMDDYNASLYGAFKSRDLMDFAVMGHHMRIINQLIPFSNAAVQGLRSSVVRAKENPCGFLGRMAAYTVIPQVGLWMLNHRNKDDAEEYENLPAYQRDMFWNVKIGANNWLSIPKPYELGMLASGVDRGLSHGFGYNKEALDGYAGSVAKVLMPVDVANVLGPVQGIAEVASNHDFFRDKSIIPNYENGLDLSLRHTERGSRLGQAIQRVAGMDSRMVDHMIRSQFSYVGNFAVKVSDIGREKNKDNFDIPDLGLFKKSPAYNSPHVQEVLDFADKWNLHQNADYKEFKGFVGNYFDAKTDAEKDKAAKLLTDYSKNLIHEWKASSIMEDKRAKAMEGKDQ